MNRPLATSSLLKLERAAVSQLRPQLIRDFGDVHRGPGVWDARCLFVEVNHPSGGLLAIDLFFVGEGIDGRPAGTLTFNDRAGALVGRSSPVALAAEAIRETLEQRIDEVKVTWSAKNLPRFHMQADELFEARPRRAQSIVNAAAWLYVVVADALSVEA